MNKGTPLEVFAHWLQEEKLSTICHKLGLQSCAFCDDLACVDNTSAEAKEWREQLDRAKAQEDERPC